MKQDRAILSQTPLFTGIPKEAMETVITDFSAVEKTYRKAEVVLLPGRFPRGLALCFPAVSRFPCGF